MSETKVKANAGEMLVFLFSILILSSDLNGYSANS